MTINDSDATGKPLEFTASVAYTQKGEQLIALPLATITFSSNLINRFSNHPEMHLSIDGESVTVSSDKTGAGSDDASLSRYENEIELSVSPEMFTRMAHARKLEVKVDSLAFQLNDEQRKGLWLLSILIDNIPPAT